MNRAERRAAGRQRRTQLKHLHKRQAGSHLLSEDDLEMLSHARGLVNATPNVFDMAKDSVLFVADLDDDVAALVFVSYMLARLPDERANDPDERERVAQMVEDCRGRFTARPLISFWVPRNIDSILRGFGSNLPADWAPMLAAPPPPGAINTVLKRDSKSSLLAVDYEHIPAADGQVLNGLDVPQQAN